MSTQGFIVNDLDMNSTNYESRPTLSSEDTTQRPTDSHVESTESDVSSYQPEATTTSDEDNQVTDSDTQEITDYFSTVADEYNEQGSISDDTYQELASMGLPPEIIETYFSGLQAIEELSHSEIVSSVGGQADLDNLIAWAGDALTYAEIDSFNAVLDNGSNEDVKKALSTLKSKHDKTVGVTQKPSLKGTQKPTAKPKLYASREEWLRDSTDPRYKSNAVYRDKVDRKFLASRQNIFS